MSESSLYREIELTPERALAYKNEWLPALVRAGITQQVIALKVARASRAVEEIIDAFNATVTTERDAYLLWEDDEKTKPQMIYPLVRDSLGTPLIRNGDVIPDAERVPYQAIDPAYQAIYQRQLRAKQKVQFPQPITLAEQNSGFKTPPDPNAIAMMRELMEL